MSSARALPRLHDRQDFCPCYALQTGSRLSEKSQLMVGLAILKQMHDLSDEVLCERWIENPYYQLFCGEEFFQHALVFDRSSMTRWRQRMGEEKLVASRRA
jgi:Transposase domain (DUF772)